MMRRILKADKEMELVVRREVSHPGPESPWPRVIPEVRHA